MAVFWKIKLQAIENLNVGIGLKINKMENKVKLGTYKAFKGPLVKVIGVAQHTEDPEKEFVVYEHTYEDGKMQLWIRPKEMFLEEVERDGYKGPRFEYVGE